MSSISNRYQRSSRLLEGALAVFCAAMAVYNFFFSTPYYVFLSLLGLLIVFVPRLVELVLRLHADYLLHLASHLYILFVYGIGMIFNGYDRIPGYDKVMHTITGVVFGLCGLIVFYLLKPKEQGEMKVEKGEFWQAALFAAGDGGDDRHRLGDCGVLHRPGAAQRPAACAGHRCERHHVGHDCLHGRGGAVLDSDAALLHHRQDRNFDGCVRELSPEQPASGTGTIGLYPKTWKESRSVSLFLLLFTQCVKVGQKSLQKKNVQGMVDKGITMC